MATTGARDGLSVVALAPVADLHDAWTRRLSDTAVEGLLGGTPHDYPDRYATACPTRRLPLGVPVRVIHGTADTSVPFDMSEMLIGRATGAGDDCALVALKNSDHFDLVNPDMEAFGVVRRVVRELVGTGWIRLPGA
jgi:fermentation-respiration switch protein FrsA (DUF1100 family)